ncbi:hypothetical protein OCU04_009984 [Sclerotinia nivalis]|uniref:Heterokaryon incompatibility domain-containing protein n=1 Tax=Sclerotinia nivalis TaxID=352851 RepID=A0A9X0DFG8_9HELO|nr:hypothetical protein OCU04_009984 [Sclerotinia nivalis]
MSFEDDSLCSVCRRVDWKDLVERPLDPAFTSERPYYNDDSHPLGRFVRTMEKSHKQLKSSKCRSCQILSIIKDEDGDEEWWNGEFYVRHLEVTTLESQVQLHPPACRQGSLALLQIGNWQRFDNETGWGSGYGQGGRYIALFGPGKDPAPFKIPLFTEDFIWVRNAISECCQQHASCLSAHSLFVPGLLVIDCLADSPTLSLVSAPKSCQYAALSYVWGGAHATSTEVAAVIKDAIKVTVKLGLRFLWVDKYVSYRLNLRGSKNAKVSIYCIPQDSEKHRLIRRMDEIYAMAYITIIAAAGKTAADGLPGISTVPRIAQMETQVGGCTFLELPSILDSARASTWAQRGWTYQEGLLSTRCLVFTDRGVLYHCRGRYVDESVQQLIPPDTAAFMNDRNLLPTLFATKKTEYHQLQVRIVQYTQRQLSYPQDSLDAFLGVFAEYERQKAALVSPCSEVPSVLSSASRSVSLPSHIWGLPLREGAPMLDWYHPIPPKRRRPDFPTWSWSGWEGGIEFGDKPFTSRYSSTDSTFAPISVEIPDKLTDFCDQKTKRLYVTGATVTLKFATQEQTQSIIDGTKQLPNTGEFPNLDVRTSHHHGLFEVFPGIFAVIRSTLDIKPEVEDQTFGLLVTVQPSSEKGSFSIRSIIVLRKGDQSFTRIGCIKVNDFWERKFVNIEGASIGKEMLPSNIKDGLSFGQEYIRQRICLE